MVKAEEGEKLLSELLVKQPGSEPALSMLTSSYVQSGRLPQANLVEATDLRAAGAASAGAVHAVVETIKVAKSDVYRYVADPLFTTIPTTAMLSKDYAAAIKRSLDPRGTVGDYQGTYLTPYTLLPLESTAAALDLNVLLLLAAIMSTISETMSTLGYST